MASCAAYNCSNRIGTNLKDITFHRFPLSKPDILSKWLTAMRKEKWQPTKNDIMCSDHFTDDQFVENNGYRFLMFNAVPTKFEVLCAPKKLFPSEWCPRMMTIRDIEVNNRNGYVIEARVPLKTKDEFYEWLKEHETISHVSYILLKNYPITNKNLSFKAEYVCQYGTTPDISTPSDKRNCPARLLVRIRSDPKFRFQNKPSMDGSSEATVLAFPCTIVLYHLHNHSVGSNSIEAQSAEEISPFVKQKFVEMFKGGYSVELALNTHQKDLQEEHADEYEAVLSDPVICPSPDWLNDFYINFLEMFGEWNDEKMMSVLQDEMEDINASKGKTSMGTVGENLVIALCTPLMQRAHSLKSAGEIVFVDSTGFLERCHCYVYVLMAYSCTEGLPLGVVITTSDAEHVLVEGFNLLAEIVPQKAFGQFGRQGPEVFLTTNEAALQGALKAAYPDTAVLLCSYSLSQMFWRWLWNSENGIAEEDRCSLFTVTHNMLRVKDAEEFAFQCNVVATDEVAQRYANFQGYFEEIKNVSDTWAVCFKNEILDKDKEISAIEMAGHVLKDRAYLTRAYNVLQLLKYYTDTMETYYRQKMIHSINNNLEQFTISSFKQELRNVSDLTIQESPSGQYELRNIKNNSSYFVDVNIFACSCPLGLTGELCRHLYAVLVAKKITFTSAVPRDDVIKRELFWIATDTMKSGGFGTPIEVVGSGSDSDTTPGESSRVNAAGNQKEESRKILERVMKNIMEKYDSNAVEFHKAIVTAAVNYQNLNNDREIIHALKTFGKGNVMRK